MSVFNRTDKAPDPAPRPVTPPEKIDMSTPIPTAEPKRPQPVAQPLTSDSAPQTASIISRALKITGQLESSENIQIDGEVEGDIRAVSVKLGAASKVKGTVYGDDVELAGTVEGKIEAKRVVLTHTAHMTGDVIHEDISIQSGAYIDGHCRPTYGKTDAKRVAPVMKTELIQAKGADA